MKLRIYCPECETSARLGVPGATQWQCPTCDHIVSLPTAVDAELSTCAACGGHELYRKKDFPHALGMGILVGAILASTITYWLYDKWLTWVFLLGSAAFDGLLYLWVKDVIVCYRCQAEHRAVEHPEKHAPFELTIHERYRQERLRKDELARRGAG